MGNAYDNASLIVTPNAYKASKIYALKPTDGSGDLSFTRAGSKMVRNSSGLWETIGTNIPPLHYPVGGGCPSWLFEAESTNIFLSSEFTENTNWFPLNCSKVLNSIQSPKDGFLATKVIEDTSNDVHLNLQLSTGGSNANHTISFYAKTNGRNIGVFNNGSGDPLNAVFNLTAGTVSGSGSPTITDAGSGWWLCTCQYNPSISTYNIQLRLLNGTTASYLGDGVSGVYIWNTQMELGSTATSPIITEGSSATRLADVASKADFGNTSTEGTVYYEIIASNIDSPNGQYIFQLFEGSSVVSTQYAEANSLCIIANGSTLQVRNNNSSTIYSFTPVDGTTYKIAITYNGSTISVFVDGVKVVNSVADTAVGVKNAFSIKNGELSIQQTRNIIFYQIVLSDLEAIELTTL